MKNAVKHTEMNLGFLIRESEGIINLLHGDPSVKISSIEYNSAMVKKGSLFVAVEGFVRDGHDYVKDAVGKGAAAIVISGNRKSGFLDLKDHAAILTSDDSRKALSRISAAYYGYPAGKVPLIGITGTNGKTSTTYMIESILKNAGMSPGVAGTVDHRWKEKKIQAKNTTPESKDLHELFSEMVSDGADAIIMEVSSHSLKLSRVDDMDFDAAAFTNLTRDHLDFHETFEDYFESKKLLFSLLDRSSKKSRSAIINTDDEYGNILIKQKNNYSSRFYSIGIDSDPDYKVDRNSIRNSMDGISYMLEKPAEMRGRKIDLNVTGKFQVYNSLTALAVCRCMGVPVETILKGLSDIKTIPGRFDRLKSETGFSIIIDYAHTNDALEKLLNSVNELPHGKIITLIGCGGNRDKSKRPLMGKAAVRNSDRVIITSDNPRNEDPDDIIRDIVEGLDADNFEIQPDREKAIKMAIDSAEKDDIVVIAGKGHEDYQIIGDKRIHFDDREIAGKYIRERDRA